MQSPEMGIYRRVHEPPHVYLVRREWEPFLLDHMRSDFGSVAPQDRTAHRDGRVEHFSYLPSGAPGPVLVRRASRGSVAAALGDLHLGASRFYQELRFNETARKAGVNVPEIVAARLSRVGAVFRRYLFVVREIPGACNLYRFAQNAGAAERRRAIRAFGEAVRQMHESGIYHGDLTLRNVLLSARGNGVQIHFIDFDRGRIEAEKSDVLAEGNLRRLNRFVEKWLSPSASVTRTDKLRFLTAYARDRQEARRLAPRLGGRRLLLHRLWWALTGHAQ